MTLFKTLAIASLQHSMPS
eukprot:Gb_01634 [translate_table: standard]